MYITNYLYQFDTSSLWHTGWREYDDGKILSVILDFSHCAYECDNYDGEVFNRIEYADQPYVPWGIARATYQYLIGAIL